MKACIAILLSLICLSVFAEPGARPRPVYPES